ncbi:hypothetical protein [Pseudomonas sp. EZ-C24]|uniref:hypothetical protein n=1 Tax=Pseudomonas sp. EZ-C24 TaxID=2753617 RepID=UPI00165D8F97|nr:hypothetical protein [Pseudomonas sp. EZ-C24]
MSKNNFIITYRIRSDETYQARYDSFIRTLKASGDQKFWNETSSFFALGAKMTAQELCYDLCNKTGFNCATDMVVVLDTSNRELASSGVIQDPELLSDCLGF